VSRIKDERLAEVAFRNIDRLKSEKAVLITKAISWLLRSMVKHYKADVASYIKKSADTLPKIAVRETMVKLKTGKKTKSVDN
jgi:3-methyladenine DNA glycosylase AlkD